MSSPIEDGLIIRVIAHRGADPSRQGGGRSPRKPDRRIILSGHLIERNEIDYDAHADLLYKLAGQIVARLRSYLETDAEVENALLRARAQLADFVFAQMMQHYNETPLGEEDYEVRVTRGFTLLRSQPFSVPKGQAGRTFRQPVTPVSDTQAARIRRLREVLLSASKVRL